MRLALVALLVGVAGTANAASHIVVVGPAAVDANTAEVKKRLPPLVASTCAYNLTGFDAPCDDLRCAVDTMVEGRANYALEARFQSQTDGTATIELILSKGPRLDVIAKAVTPPARTGAELMTSVARALPAMCTQGAVAKLPRTALDAPSQPITDAEASAAVQQSAPEMLQCQQKARIGAARPSPTDPVVIEWVVRANGMVGAPTLVSPLQSAFSAAPDCFTRVMSNWKFTPRERAEVKRGYQLNLDPAAIAAPQPVAFTPVDKLSDEDVKAGVKSYAETLGPCITAAKARQEISARRYVFVMDWIILPSGATTAPELVGPPELMRTTLRACFEKAILGWKFRTAKSSTPVTEFALPITVR